MARIGDEQLAARKASWPWRAHPFELVLVQLLVALTLLFTGSTILSEHAPPSAAYQHGDDTAWAAPGFDDSAWPRAPVWQIRPTDQSGASDVVWVRWHLPAALSGPEPLAIQTSGPYSAAFYLNGDLIGMKGDPGGPDSPEQAGPIDQVIALPMAQLSETANVLAIRMRSTRAGYEPAALIQSLQITPYAADARRSLRYYAPAILLMGTLFPIALALANLSRRPGGRAVRWLAIGTAGLIIAALAEVSRSLINYPYSWHQPRQLIALIGIALFGAMLVLFAIRRWAAPAPRWPLWLCGAAAIFVVILTLLAGGGYDGRSWVAILGFSLIAIGWCSWRAYESDRLAGPFALALLCLPVMAWLAPGDFLDRGLYALAVSLMGLCLMRLPDYLRLPVAPDAPRPPSLAILASGRTDYVAYADIIFCKAAGNYTEVHTRSGRTLLDNRGLTKLADALPDSFFRLHRSHLVNLDHARTLRAAEGSRYALELESGDTLPVSRQKVDTLRTLLAGAPAPTR